MTKTRRIIIFSESELDTLYCVPRFDSENRKQYFNFSEEETALINESRDIHCNIYTSIQLAYFKAKIGFIT